jgi:hypothetical protein
MSKKKQPEQVSSCLTCEGDEMLEVRKHANEAFQIMNLLTLHHGKAGGGYNIVQWVEALIKAEAEQRRLVGIRRREAEFRVKQAEQLIAALRFVSRATQQESSNGIAVGGKSLTVQLSEVFRVAIADLQYIIASDKGLLDGKQSENERNFVEELFAYTERNN